MLHQARFDVGRRHPQAADLDHVVRASLVDEQDLLIGMAMRRYVPAGRQILGSHRERPRSCRPGFHEDLDRAPMFTASEPENLAVTAPTDMVHRSLLSSRTPTFARLSHPAPLPRQCL